MTIVVDEDHVYASGSAPPARLGTAGAGGSDAIGRSDRRLSAQQDDVTTTPGRTMKPQPPATAMALRRRRSPPNPSNKGWREPELIGREHRQRFAGAQPPIVADDVLRHPEAIASVIACSVRWLPR